MILVTRPELYQVLRQTNSTASSITPPSPSFTPPWIASRDGFISCVAPDGINGIAAVRIVPFGTTTSTQTMLFNVYGWSLTLGNQQTFPTKQRCWIAQSLGNFTATLGTVPGLTGADVDQNQLFAGSITQQLGNTNYTSEILSPGGNTVCSCVVAVKDSFMIEVRFSINASSVSCNALYKRL